MDGEGCDECGEDEAARIPQPGEDAAEVVTHGREDDVGSITGAAFEVAAPEVAFSLQVSDDGLDGGAAAQLALDDTEDAALLARDEDTTGILRVVDRVPARGVTGGGSPRPPARAGLVSWRSPEG